MIQGMINLKRKVGVRILGGVFFTALALSASTFDWVPKACADDIYTIVIKKQEDKDRYRWTLSDWLYTRDTMRIQDLWLALHSPSPYEFFLGGNYQFDHLTPGGTLNPWELHFGAFVSIFGLEAHYESTVDNQWSGIFDLRVFGYHDQSTNITLQVGLRDRSNGSYSIDNIFTGARFTIYLARAFGVEMLYRHFFTNSTPTSTGVGISSDRFQGGVFLDYKFLRIYGDYFTEYDANSTLNGIIVGPKIYF